VPGNGNRPADVPGESRPARTPASVLVRSNMRVRPREAAEPRAAERRIAEPPAIEAPAAPRLADSPPVGRAQVPGREPDQTLTFPLPVDASRAEPHQAPARPDDGRSFEPEPTPVTPNGLPRRVRQASLAAPLYDDKPPAPEQHGNDDPMRAPEDIRRMMASYQTGTMRGRTEAQQRSSEVDTPVEAPAWPTPPRVPEGDGEQGDRGPTDSDASLWTSKNPWDR
jgi:hypothetical protein